MAYDCKFDPRGSAAAPFVGSPSSKSNKASKAKNNKSVREEPVKAISIDPFAFISTQLQGDNKQDTLRQLVLFIPMDMSILCCQVSKTWKAAIDKVDERKDRRCYKFAHLLLFKPPKLVLPESEQGRVVKHFHQNPDRSDLQQLFITTIQQLAENGMKQKWDRDFVGLYNRILKADDSSSSARPSSSASRVFGYNPYSYSKPVEKKQGDEKDRWKWLEQSTEKRESFKKKIPNAAYEEVLKFLDNGFKREADKMGLYSNIMGKPKSELYVIGKGVARLDRQNRLEDAANLQIQVQGQSIATVIISDEISGYHLKKDIHKAIDVADCMVQHFRQNVRSAQQNQIDYKTTLSMKVEEKKSDEAKSKATKGKR